MTLPAGTRIGRYEISSPLGAGGMGEVYRAHDTRIGRDVALKVLPATFAADADRLRRFEQEARTTGLLNHPNILTLHDLGTISAADDPALAPAIGAPYLVSELLEGRTLRQRLGSGALSLEESLGFARQILDGLAAAHDKGIVHRDLKPENLFLTDAGPLKILDFGLAKLSWVESAGRALGDASTALATESGLVVGTVGYMSPEQIRGGAIDARSDLFSFGIILFEMLTGERPFRRETPADTMSAILNEQPPTLVSLVAHLPISSQRFVGHCLEKNAAKRFQSAHDALFALESESLSVPAQSAPRRERTSTARSNRRIALVAFATVAALAGAWILRAWMNRTSSPEISRNPPRVSPLITGEAYESSPAWSPAGNLVAYVSDAAGNDDIWICDPSGASPINLTAASPDAEAKPAWSPDGQRIAFFSERNNGGIFVMPALGGPAQRVVALPASLIYTFSLSWSHGDVLVYTGRDSNGKKHVYRASVSRGEPTCLTCELPGHDGERSGEISPSGVLLAFLSPHNGPRAELFVLELRSGRVHSLADQVDAPHWSANGDHLTFVSDRDGIADLWQIAVDPATGSGIGEIERLTSGLGVYSFAESPDGRRIVIQRESSASNLWSFPTSLERVESLAGGERLTRGIFFDGRGRWSPNGREIYFESNRRGSDDIWKLALGQVEPVRITSGSGSESRPRVAPDGRWLALDVISESTGRSQVHFMRPDGSELHLGDPSWAERFRVSCCADWSLDGSRLAMLVTTPEGKSATAISEIDLTSSSVRSTTVVDLPGEADEYHRWSPDGRWIVYEATSDDSWNLFLSDPEAHAAHQLTTDPGDERQAAWRRDGTGILFIKDHRSAWVLELSEAGQPKGAPRSWLQLPGRAGVGVDSLDFSPDGQRLLVSIYEPASDLWLVELSE